MTVLYRALIIIALTSLSLMAQAQSSGPDWTQAKEIDVTMTNFAFVPDSLDLTAGVANHSHFVNSGVPWSTLIRDDGDESPCALRQLLRSCQNGMLIAQRAAQSRQHTTLRLAR